jgi:hypothetical protein
MRLVRAENLKYDGMLRMASWGRNMWKSVTIHNDFKILKCKWLTLKMTVVLHL